MPGKIPASGRETWRFRLWRLLTLWEAALDSDPIECLERLVFDMNQVDGFGSGRLVARDHRRDRIADESDAIAGRSPAAIDCSKSVTNASTREMASARYCGAPVKRYAISDNVGE